MKKRTQNKFLNAAVSAMRVAFARYSPKVGELLEKSRVELPKYKKDGTLAKKPAVWFRCALCTELVKQPNTEVDHIEPVVEIGKTRSDYTLDEYIKRLDCDPSNLQLICKLCHKHKSGEERKKRQEAKKCQ